MVRHRVESTDVRAYDTKKLSGSGCIDYEEERFSSGMAQNAIDFSLATEASEGGERTLQYNDFVRLIRKREAGSISDSGSSRYSSCHGVAGAMLMPMPT